MGIKGDWPHYFVEYKAISKIFAVSNHQYIVIHHTKKQAENILSSCSFQFLKALFHFLSHKCISVTYLESGLCKLGKALDKCNYFLWIAKKQTFFESNYNA